MGSSLKSLIWLQEIFHAILNKDVDTFEAGLDQLHPSPHDQMVCIVMLSKLSRALYRLKHTDTPPDSLWGTGRDIVYLGSHFTDRTNRDPVDAVWYA